MYRRSRVDEGIVFPPIIDIGFLAKRRRPQTPTYLLRQPADQSRMKYSKPKKTTRTISCQRHEGSRRRRMREENGWRRTNQKLSCVLLQQVGQSAEQLLQQSAPQQPATPIHCGALIISIETPFFTVQFAPRDNTILHVFSQI